MREHGIRVRVVRVSRAQVSGDDAKFAKAEKVCAAEYGDCVTVDLQPDKIVVEEHG